MTTQITPFTTTPSRQNPSTFSADRDVRLQEEASRILQMNALAAELNALAAAMTLNATTSTSTTSLTVGTGSKSLTVGTAKSFWPGNPVQIAYNSSNWMHGIVTSYNSSTGALVVNVTNSSGSGTYASWTITLSGPIAMAGLTPTVTELNYLAGLTAVAAELNLLDGALICTAELNNRFVNLGLAASVSSNILTVSLKGANGSDPSATNIVAIPFRSATVTTGTPVTRTVTGALSVALSSGSTLGFTSSLAGRIYVWAIDNAGTVELALSRTADIYPESNLVSTTAEGGAGAADSATTMYSATARTNVACRCIGYVEITTGSTAGQWSNAPTKIQPMLPGIKRTGDIVQGISYQTGAYATGTTVMPSDDTIPQISEGDQYVSKAITPTSAINKLEIDIILHFSGDAVDSFSVALFQDSTANALASSFHAIGYTTALINFKHSMTAGTSSSTTFKVRAGVNTAGGNLYFNGQSAARKHGGVCASSIKITEVMA